MNCVRSHINDLCTKIVGKQDSLAKKAEEQVEQVNKNIEQVKLDVLQKVEN